MIAFCQEKSLHEIREATRALEESDKVLINAMLHLHKANKNELYHSNVEILLQDAIEMMFENIEKRDFSSLNYHAENLDTLMQIPKLKKVNDLLILTMLQCLEKHSRNNPKFDFAYLTTFKISLEFCEVKPTAVVLHNYLDNTCSFVILQCRYQILNNQLRKGIDVDEQELVDFLRSFEALIESEKPLLALKLFDHIRVADWSSMWSSSKESLQIMTNATQNLLLQLSSTDDHLNLLNFLEVLLSSVYWGQEQVDWIHHVTNCLEYAMQKCCQSDKAKVLEIITNSFDFGESTTFQESSLRDYIKKLLLEKLTEVEMLTKDQQ